MGPACLLTLLSAAAGAADAPPSATLAWDACVREATASSPVLREARLRLAAARDRRLQSFSGFLPRLTASLGASDGGGTPYFDGLALRDWSARLAASQSLFAGFATVADVRSATAAERAERERWRDTSAQVRQTLRQSYVTLLVAQENVRVLGGIADRRRTNADLVRLRYEAGREDKGSALRAEADARSAAFDRDRAGRALVLARQALARDLGRDEFGPLAAAPDWDAPPPPAAPDLAALAETSPAVGQAAAASDGARADRLAARAPFLPAADASAGVGQEGPRWPFADAKNWSAGVSLSWNLFAGGRDVWAEAAARSRAAQAAEALARTRRETRVALQQALFADQDAAEGLQVQTQFLAAAAARAEIARAQYANGTMGYQEWDQIESDFIGAERAEVGARRDALLAAAGWDRAIARGLEER